MEKQALANTAGGSMIWKKCWSNPTTHYFSPKRYLQACSLSIIYNSEKQENNQNCSQENGQTIFSNELLPYTYHGTPSSNERKIQTIGVIPFMLQKNRKYYEYKQKIWKNQSNNSIIYVLPT